jgi:hypothetical protein
MAGEPNYVGVIEICEEEKEENLFRKMYRGA